MFLNTLGWVKILKKSVHPLFVWQTYVCVRNLILITSWCLVREQVEYKQTKFRFYIFTEILGFGKFLARRVLALITPLIVSHSKQPGDLNFVDHSHLHHYRGRDIQSGITYRIKRGVIYHIITMNIRILLLYHFSRFTRAFIHKYATYEFTRVYNEYSSSGSLQVFMSWRIPGWCMYFCAQGIIFDPK